MNPFAHPQVFAPKTEKAPPSKAESFLLGSVAEDRSGRRGGAPRDDQQAEKEAAARQEQPALARADALPRRPAPGIDAAQAFVARQMAHALSSQS